MLKCLYGMTVVMNYITSLCGLYKTTMCTWSTVKYANILLYFGNKPGKAYLYRYIYYEFVQKHV